MLWFFLWPFVWYLQPVVFIFCGSEKKGRGDSKFDNFHWGSPFRYLDTVKTTQKSKGKQCKLCQQKTNRGQGGQGQYSYCIFFGDLITTHCGIKYRRSRLANKRLKLACYPVILLFLLHFCSLVLLFLRVAMGANDPERQRHYSFRHSLVMQPPLRRTVDLENRMRAEWTLKPSTKIGCSVAVWRKNEDKE